MYLHIIDDSKTINHFIRRVKELASDKHHFLVITPSGKWSHISFNRNMTALIPTSSNIRIAAGSLSKYKAVFVHNLCYTKSRMVLEAPTETVFVWGIWGYDYYNVYPELYHCIFLPYTQLANISLAKLSLSVKYLQYQIHPLTKIFGAESSDRIRKKAAHRIDYTINNMPLHSEVFRVIPVIKSRRFQHSYYSIDYLTEGLHEYRFDLGENILVGNSASNSSNHIDAFLQIRHQTDHRKIFVPMGYGSSRYRKLVNLIGRSIFKKHYKPINEFLPLHEYHKLLLSCNVMIFNHRRAQGLGNILFGIWAGHRVFLRQSNPVFSYLKSIGIKVFSFDTEWNSNALTPLEEEWKTHNRNTIQTHYNESRIKEDLNAILSEIDRISSKSK